jgi:hypothetical protein
MAGAERVSESLAIGGSGRPRATSPVGVACLALLTVAAAYALSAAPALATGQTLLRAPASWLAAPLGARAAHADALTSGAQHAKPSAHGLATAPLAAAREPAGALRLTTAPLALIILIAALLVAVALALAR